jgi:hypothetical protein
MSCNSLSSARFAASRLKGLVRVKTGDLDGGSPLLRAGLHRITEPHAGLWFLTGLGQMAEALGQAGRIADGMAKVERGVDRSQRESRAATSLARLPRDRGRPTDATACLQPVYDRFIEGFGTADLFAAKQLLDDPGVAGQA